MFPSMNDPHIADKKPAVLTLEPGTYWWCACGLSKEQPFCDGTHKGGDFRPLQIKIDAAKKVALCNCKHSANKPYCDGAHARLG